MIQSAKLTRSLDRAYVGRLLDSADETRIAPRIAADRAHLILTEVEAVSARTHALGKRYESVSETAAVLCRLLEQVIREAERGLSSDSWKPGKLGRQRVDCGHARTEA